MRRITITLKEDERKALLELARLERRDARAQAAFLIGQELRRLNLLQLQKPELVSSEDRNNES